MARKYMLIGLLLLSTILQAQQQVAPPSLIFDTDMGPDYDDVGAITLLHHFADQGEAKLLATIACTRYEGVAGVLSVLNTYFKRPDLPIGVPKGWAYEKKDIQHWTDSLLARYPHRYSRNDEAPDAVGLYRKILAAEPDKSVTIVTVGFFTNLNNLYQSGPDQYSSLSGADLLRQKVKQIVSMAGKFPEGKEFNVYKDSTAAYQLFQHLDLPVIFTGWEIGARIKTGLRLIANDQIQGSPVKDVFRISIPQAAGDSAGRMSWDQTAVLIAVRGTAPFFGLQKGRIHIRSNGSNTWTNDPKGNAVYVTAKMPDAQLAAYIEDLMMYQPH